MKLSLDVKKMVYETMKSCPDISFTSMAMMRLCNGRHASYDWHEYGYYLQELEAQGAVKATGLNKDGLTLYMYQHGN